jgi:hypothetical protein
MTGHLCKIRTLATQQILHGLIAIGLPTTKKIDVLPGPAGSLSRNSLCHNVVFYFTT